MSTVLSFSCLNSPSQSIRYLATLFTQLTARYPIQKSPLAAPQPDALLLEGLRLIMFVFIQPLLIQVCLVHVEHLDLGIASTSPLSYVVRPGT